MATHHPNQRTLSSLPPELRRTTVPPSVQAWIASATGADVVRTRRLTGASSSAVHGVWLSDRSRLVLRRYVWPGFLEDEPIAPRREVDALRFAHARADGVPAPEVVAADVDGEAVGDGIPVVLMSFLPGRAIAVPDLGRLAELAAAIHAVPADDLGHDYFAWYASTMTAPPAGSDRPALWERALDVWHNAVPEYRPTFIHRDFHPGNVLWSRGHPSGVVDWPNACRGPWGCDIAHCRDSLISLSGVEAADRFLSAYESVTGETFDPFWEVASVLEHGPQWWTPAWLARSERRLERALRHL